MIELEFMELHQDLFLAGKNMGKKLDEKRLSGLKILFHPEKSMCTVEYNGKVAFFHWMNAANMVAKNPEEIGVQVGPPLTSHVQPTFQTHPQRANIAKTAQVETPMDHVFKGKGAGKVRDTQA